MIDVTVANFEAEVVTASRTTPVLVDFWADWCGPCTSLGPILEKLETAYAGRFKLVKINADTEQQITGMFGVRSLPTCVLMSQGQPLDGFTGALPEGQVRAFLDKHLPPAAEPEPELTLEDEAPPLVPGSDDAIAVLQEAVQQAPDNDEARADLLRSLLLAGRDDEAKIALAPVMPKIGTHRAFTAVQQLLDAIDLLAASAVNTWAIGQFDAKIAENKRDFATRYQLAQLHITQRRWTAAMDELLEILMRDKTWSDDLARKTYIAILEVIEPPKVKVADGHIPPQDPTVATYRRRLSSVVLS
jgi:putative thioredoxin